MSSQPFPPSGIGSAPGAPTGTPRRNPVLLVVGLVLVIAGVVGGLLLVQRSSSSVSDNARKLARAPGGCTTSLQFDDTGEFMVFYESKGRVADLGGDCGANGAPFDRGDDSPPAQTLRLIDPDDNVVSLDDTSGTSYDAGGFKGEQIAKVSIETPGLYRLTVAPRDVDDAEYAIAIGKDPTGDESTLKAAGLGVLIGGVVLGILLMLLGLRRRGGSALPLVSAIPGTTWTPAARTPTWPPQPPTTHDIPPRGFDAPRPPAPSRTPTAPPSTSSWPPDSPWTPTAPPPQDSPWMPATPPPPSPFAPPRPRSDDPS